MYVKVEVLGAESIRVQLRQLSGPEALRAMRMGINRVGRIAQTEADRAIRARFAIPRDQVRGSMVFVNAKGGGFSKVEATLSIFGSPTKRGRSMNMARFLERKVTLAEGRRRARAGTQRDLRFKITRAGGLKTIAGAFLGNQGRTVFRRAEGAARLPIEPVQVIGVAQMFNTTSIRSHVLRRIDEAMQIEMQRAIDQVLRRAR